MSDIKKETPVETETPAVDQGAKETGETKGDSAENKEFGGPKGPEPTRYNDWERNGRCSDF